MLPRLPRLKHIRETQRALTQGELAKKAGVARTTIVRIEAGEDATVRTLRKLAQALAVEPRELTADE